MQGIINKYKFNLQEQNSQRIYYKKITTQMRKYEGVKKIDLMDRDSVSRPQSRLNSLTRSIQRSVNRQQQDNMECFTDRSRNQKTNQFSVQTVNQPNQNSCLSNSIKSNIRTYIRFKPFTKNDIMDQNTLENGIQISENNNKVSVEGHTTYSFDKIFQPQSTQINIYQYSAKQLIKSFINGYNGTIFTYGQTGSGKTYTMFGGEQQSNTGIIPRAIQDIFNEIQSLKLVAGKTISLSCSMFELYKENLYDLMTQRQKDLKIMEGSNGNVQIQNLTIKEVFQKQELIYWINKGSQQRKTRGTDMNERSSRSHLIFTLYLVVKFNNLQSRISKLNLVDLAGSQKVSKTKVSGQGLQEAIKINLSLSCLGNTIYALSKGQEHIPFRDSKLTRVLQQSLSGNSITRVIVTCSMLPSCKEETISSLKFANRIKKIKTSGSLNIKKLSQAGINKFVYQTLKASYQSCEQKLYKIRVLLDEASAQMTKQQILDSLRLIIGVQQSQNQFLSSFSNFTQKMRSPSKEDFLFDLDNNERKIQKRNQLDKQEKIIELELQIENFLAIIKKQEKVIESQSQEIDKHKQQKLGNYCKTENQQQKRTQKLKILKVNSNNNLGKIKQIKNRFKQESVCKQNNPITFRTKYQQSNRKLRQKTQEIQPQYLEEIKCTLNQIMKQNKSYESLERQILLKQVKALGVQVSHLRKIVQQTGNFEKIFSNSQLSKKIILTASEQQEILAKKIEHKDKYIQQLQKLLMDKFKIQEGGTPKQQQSKDQSNLRSSSFLKNFDTFKSPMSSCNISRISSAKLLHKC